MLDKKNIIFSLDDFGISQKANDNTLKLIETGKMDRVSVMVHGTINQEEIEKILSSGIKIDMHVDLKNKINPNRKLKDSAVKRLVIFVIDYFCGRISPSLMEQQWENKIKYFQKLFRKRPDGISSHEHVHFFPPYFKIMVKLSKKYGISYIRFGKEPYGKNSLVSQILNWLRKINLKSFYKSGMDSSDIMISFDWISSFNEFLASCPGNKKIEVVFHPEREEEMIFLENILEKID